MQFSALLFSGLACLTGVSAQYYDHRSGPFNLVLESNVNKTLNGKRLTACHSGAAIESLCLYPSAANSPSAKFYYNTSSEDTSTPKTGIITWNLPIGTNEVESESLVFNYDPSTNVALPLFYPGEDQYQVQAHFDKNGYLSVAASLDDSKTPPKYSPRLLQRWQICQTYFGSYTYTTLAWTLGSGKPQNPSCQAVKVKKQAVPK